MDRIGELVRSKVDLGTSEGDTQQTELDRQFVALSGEK
jgi:hypothetical protein